MATTSLLLGLSTVSFFAADHAAARKWYSEFLGVEPYFERPGYVELLTITIINPAMTSKPDLL